MGSVKEDSLREGESLLKDATGPASSFQRPLSCVGRKDAVRTFPNEGGVTALRLRKRGANRTCVCLLVYVSPYLRHISNRKIVRFFLFSRLPSRFNS
mmetsp:Transcript_90331/g.146136  ORF Transcript_90331/g.146136 Transcript_90331/m.146136 type:complete len:97 (-) Transcript_90331:62-352(-)